MSDRIFETSLVTLFWLVVAWIIAGVTLAVAGMRWANMDLPVLVFLTVIIGVIGLTIGGGTLLHFWGKNYMSRE